MKHHENDNEPGAESESKEGKRHFESFGEAFRSAREEAASKAKEAAPRIKSAVTKVVHELAYGSGYGAAFLKTLAGELVPGDIKGSVARGARAGQEKARAATERAREAMKPKGAAEGGEAVIDISPGPAGA